MQDFFAITPSSSYYLNMFCISSQKRYIVYFANGTRSSFAFQGIIYRFLATGRLHMLSRYKNVKNTKQNEFSVECTTHYALGFILFPFYTWQHTHYKC